MQADLAAGAPRLEARLDAMTSERWPLGWPAAFALALRRQLLLLKVDAALVRNRVAQVRVGGRAGRPRRRRGGGGGRRIGNGHGC